MTRKIILIENSYHILTVTLADALTLANNKATTKVLMNGKEIDKRNINRTLKAKKYQNEVFTITSH